MKLPSNSIKQSHKPIKLRNKVGGWIFGFVCMFLQSSFVEAQVFNVLSVKVFDAYVYVPLGKSQETEAFFTLQNNSASALNIVKVTSPQVKTIEFLPAKTTRENVADVWQLRAGQRLVLQPKQQYLRLKGLKNSLTTGDELQLEISLSNGQRIPLIARAKSAFDQRHDH